MLDLWALDPATGQFADAGDGEVAPGGSTIRTTASGVAANGLYYFVPRAEDALDPQVVFNQDTAGVENVETAPLTSVVELHSGAVLETRTATAVGVTPRGREGWGCGGNTPSGLRLTVTSTANRRGGRAPVAYAPGSKEFMSGNRCHFVR